MSTARVVLDPDVTIGAVPRRLFGSFVEHMGRCVYTGVYEPGHPAADERGFRKDVLALTKELGVTTVRYPGGNFVSGYQWEDGVGPAHLRPVRREQAWRSIETNQFGLNEFMRWTEIAGVEPMLAVNLGTRGAAEAVDLLEYCNGERGSKYADLRATHGYPDPHGVRLWCLGNEMDGPWQIGHKTAEEYGRLAAETARAMKGLDPTIELVACGSSNAGMPTFGSWESTVLRHCYDVVDYLSMHSYYEPHGDDLASFLASGVGMDRFIDAVVATADQVRASLDGTKPINLSFDEWNVWYFSEYEGKDHPEWTEAPRLIEDDYSVVDATVVGGLLISLLNHCDRVHIACQAQLVNVIAPIRTEPGGPAWRQSIFHPFALTARNAHGTALRAEVEAPTINTAEYGDVPMLDVAATTRGEWASVFLVNRSLDRAVDTEIRLQHHGPVAQAVHTVVSSDDLAATNTPDQPGRISPVSTAIRPVSANTVLVTLPRASWSMVTLAPPAE